MQLVVFDIDDTLTKSMAVDNDCFVRSLEQVFGFRNVSTDWSTYRHVTDAGIVNELFERHFERGPTAREIETFHAHFLTELRAAIELNPVEPVKGAKLILHTLCASARHDVALATGAWQASARLKLKSAGLENADIPLASSDDHFARTEILKKAIASARYQNNARSYSSTVYVGDGVWDATTCHELGLSFLGIASGRQSIKLIELGAHRVFPDFHDQSSFLDALNELAHPHK
jgi:phosphoglycolate phosphatase-like HAD superfamily hydrolase